MFLETPEDSELKNMTPEEFEKSFTNLIPTEKNKKTIFLIFPREIKWALKEIMGFIDRSEYSEEEKKLYDDYGKIITTRHVFRFLPNQNITVLKVNQLS